MNASGPIVIIEDDADEAMILKELLIDMSSQRDVVIISDSTKAIDYLQQCEKPFLILSGINLNGFNGFQLRNLILSDSILARKCTPYIFYSANATAETLTKVYDLQANGYFHGINNYDELGSRLSMIINYWEKCAV